MHGFVLRGLIYVFPFLRGVLDWFKISSLSLVERTNDLDFTLALGPDMNTYLRPFVHQLSLLAHASLLVSMWLQWRFLRKARGLLLARTAASIVLLLSQAVVVSPGAGCDARGCASAK